MSQMSRERDINISRSNYSVVDKEFGSIRERFDTEMKRVEEEMQRLRREFEINPIHFGLIFALIFLPYFMLFNSINIFGGHSRMKPLSSNPDNRSSYHREETKRYESSTTQGPPPPSSFSSDRDRFFQESSDISKNMMSNRQTYEPYLDNIKSPLIKEQSDGKTLRLRFDVANYTPEEVTVKTIDNKLLVHAKHEEKTPQRTVFREYNQEFLLPRGTNSELISSTLSTDGVLTVEAPLPQLSIQH